MELFLIILMLIYLMDARCRQPHPDSRSMIPTTGIHEIDQQIKNDEAFVEALRQQTPSLVLKKLLEREG